MFGKKPAFQQWLDQPIPAAGHAMQPTDHAQLSAVFARGPQPAPDWHMAPTCFVCGTQETLGMHPTPMDEFPVWATVWTAERDGIRGHRPQLAADL